MVGAVKPAMIQASVDLPEPLSPWISNPSPSCTTKLISRSAVLAQGVPAAYSWPTPASSSIDARDWWPTATVGAGAAAVSTIAVLSSESLRLIVRSAESASLL